MDLDHPLNCLTMNLQRAARRMTRRFEAALKAHGLSAPQFAALALLGVMGEQTTGQLAERLDADRTTLTRNLAGLVRRGLIAGVASDDQRIRAYALTPEGRARLDEALPDWRRAQRGLVEFLGEDQSEKLLSTLGELP